jgi:hypothetical protein
MDSMLLFYITLFKIRIKLWQRCVSEVTATVDEDELPAARLQVDC